MEFNKSFILSFSFEYSLNKVFVYLSISSFLIFIKDLKNKGSNNFSLLSIYSIINLVSSIFCSIWSFEKSELKI